MARVVNGTLFFRNIYHFTVLFHRHPEIYELNIFTGKTKSNYVEQKRALHFETKENGHK